MRGDRWLVGFALAGALGTSRFARADDPVAPEALPDFDKIRTPDSPAFMLLGLSPTQIERPTTPKELTVVLSKFASEGLTIPDSLAVEFAPYAILARAQDPAEYLKLGFLRDAARNATISIATTTSSRDVDDGMGGTIARSDDHLSIGARTMWRLSAPVHGCDEAELETMAAIAQEEALTGTKSGLEVTRRLLQIQTSTDADARRFAAEALELLKGDKVTDKLAALCVKDRGVVNQGALLEVAAAASFAFPDQKLDAGRYELASGWIDLAYQGKGKSAVALARIRDDKTSGVHDLFSDVGVRAILAKDAYAASAELLWRHALQRADGSTAAINTYRAALALDVHLTDGTWLTISFGRDFAAGDAGSLFSIANLKWGIGDPKIVAPTATTPPPAADPAAPPATPEPATPAAASTPPTT